MYITINDAFAIYVHMFIYYILYTYVYMLYMLYICYIYNNHN